MRQWVAMMAVVSGLYGQEQAAPPEVTSEPTPGVYRDEEGGLALRLAGGFQFLSRQNSLVIFGSKETPGAVYLESGESFSEQDLVEAARSGYQDDGVQLTPDGAARRLDLALGTGLAFPVKGTLENQAVRGLLAGVRSRTGRCFILLAAATVESWPKLARSAEEMVNRLELFAPQSPPVDLQLRQYFAGRRFSFYFSRQSFGSTGGLQGSFQNTERIYFCSDGSFFYGEQTHSSFDVPQAMGYSRSAGSSAGRWQVQAAGNAALLTLTFHDGRQWRYRATGLGSEVAYLNGSKYFRAGQTRCR